MCGIVGYIGNQRAVPIILDGLRKLEYRGYDSAGIAVLNGDNHLSVRRASGKLRNLEEAIRMNPLDGPFGIGHTRWATHGRPTEENAHPHRDCTGDIVVVHNGIIENYLAAQASATARRAQIRHRNRYGSGGASGGEILRRQPGGSVAQGRSGSSRSFRAGHHLKYGSEQNCGGAARVRRWWWGWATASISSRPMFRRS